MLANTSRASLLACSLGLLAALTSEARAQDTIALPGIVIEGASLDGAALDQRRTGSAVSVVTGAELERRQVRNAADALRALPGVTVSRAGSNAGLTQVRIRGSEANHVLVLIDGVEANAASEGEFDFSNLSTEGIERIEVLRGPQSGLYGSKAIGGVIVITTRAGSGPLQLTAKAEGGSFDTHEESAAITGGTEDFNVAVSYAKREVNGFNIAPEGDEVDGSALETLNGRINGKLWENLSYGLIARRTDKHGERDDDRFLGTGLSVQEDTPSFFNSQSVLLGANAELSLLDGRWTHKVSVEHNDVTIDDTLVSSFGAFYFENNSIDKSATYSSTLRFDAPDMGATHYLTGLVERELEAHTQVTGDMIERGRATTSYAAEWRGEFADQLFLAATGRRDGSDVFGDFDTWRATASLAPTDSAFRLHASAGTGVKFPTLFEQFGEFSGFVPNPDLAPEEAFGWDTGVEVTLAEGRLVTDVTYFASDLESQIVPTGGFPSSVENLAGTSTREGIEVTMKALLTDDLTLSAACTFLNAERPDGSAETRRPTHSARADLAWAFANGRGHVDLGVIYNGAMQDEAFRLPFFDRERVGLDDYVIVNVAVSYQLTDALEAFGRVENLFDEDYQEVYGFETAGLAAYAGVRVKLEPDGGSAP